MARGLAYLHQSLPYFHRPPHGNLKSSNVLVFFSAPAAKGKQQQQPKLAVAKLTDHGFHPLLPHHAHRLAAAGGCRPAPTCTASGWCCWSW